MDVLVVLTCVAFGVAGVLMLALGLTARKDATRSCARAEARLRVERERRIAERRLQQITHAALQQMLDSARRSS